MTKTDSADKEESVSVLYQDTAVASSYIKQRFEFTWSELLHRTQVDVVNRCIASLAPQKVLEVAPGPARLTTDINGVSAGTLVEYSEQMLEVARQRLAEVGKEGNWTLLHGNAFELSQYGDGFDLLYTFRFIRHFDVEDRARLYRQMSEVMAPGGTLIFDVVGRAVRDALDAQAGKKPDENLDVYDARYSLGEFSGEMDEFDFDVVEMRPVLKHFGLQSNISYKLDRRIRGLAKALIGGLELLPSSAPLEWVAVCRKRH